MGIIQRILGIDNTEYRKLPVADALAAERVKQLEDTVSEQQLKLEAMVTDYWQGGTVTQSNIFTLSYDGEKNKGEIGPIRHYLLDYDGMRARSWQAFLDSEIAQTVIGRKIAWVIGDGLRLQCEPQINVLRSENIKLEEAEVFNEMVEARFGTYAESPLSSYSGEDTLHELAEEAEKNAIVGGDVLIVRRYGKNGMVTVELIDGVHVRNPLGLSFTGGVYMAANGNRVVNGVELDNRGGHVAYYVKRSPALGDFERIEAFSKRTGLRVANLKYGLKYRLNNVRGVPLIIAVMETIKKLERYKEAVVGSAEERAKIVLQITRELNATGENPLAQALVKAAGVGARDDLPTDSYGRSLQNNIVATTNKQVVDMPGGTKLESLDSKTELVFGEFYLPMFDIICATVNIPPNVAMSKYDSNFSASRAALKDWEHTLQVDRRKLGRRYYQPTYELWLHTQILAGKIEAPGYMQAYAEGNVMAMAAYRKARWEGVNVPHIDPEKEVRAERLKLGDKGSAIPLTTVEAATRNVNGGDSTGNIEQFAKEYAKAEELGIVSEPAAPAPPTDPPPANGA